MGAITYFYLDSNIHDHMLHYNLVPVVIVMIGTYLISSVFFGVYSMAVDTLFLCFRKSRKLKYLKSSVFLIFYSNSS